MSDGALDAMWVVAAFVFGVGAGRMTGCLVADWLERRDQRHRDRRYLEYMEEYRAKHGTSPQAHAIQRWADFMRAAGAAAGQAEEESDE